MDPSEILLSISCDVGKEREQFVQSQFEHLVARVDRLRRKPDVSYSQLLQINDELRYLAQKLL